MRKHPLLASASAIIVITAAVLGYLAGGPLINSSIPVNSTVKPLSIRLVSVQVRGRPRPLTHHRRPKPLRGAAKHHQARPERRRHPERTKAPVRHLVTDYHPLAGVWSSLRTCESNDNYAEDSGNGYYGAYQFSLSSWYAVGYKGRPDEAGPEVQDAAAVALQARQGWRAWPTCSAVLGL